MPPTARNPGFRDAWARALGGQPGAGGSAAPRRYWTVTGPHATFYRPEIDGLRAIAVVAVMLFHAQVPGFGGGYLGVDIFFVISGFLITTIIRADLAAGRFSLAGFYTRRARRIIPALALVMLACLPAAWVLMLPHELKDLAKSVFAVATFSSNLLFWLEADYFAPDAHLNPLLHTWSLAVEEQFYLVFPIAILLLWKLGKRPVAAIFLTLALASIAAQLAQDDPNAAFFLTPYRVWELLAGALAAGAHNRGPGRKHGEGMLAGIGVALVLGAIAVLEADPPMRGLAALPAVAGTVLILLCGRGGTAVGRWLAHPGLVGIGLVSYSLYLWHQPLLAFDRIGTLGPLSLLERLALLAAAFPLAYLSWALVERPFRDRGRVSASVIWLATIAFTAACVMLGLVGFKSDGFHDLKVAAVPADLRESIIDRPKELARRRPVWTALLRDADRPFTAAPRGRVLILGDSKSEDIYVSTQLMPQLFDGLSIRRQGLGRECMADLVRRPAGPLASWRTGHCQQETADIRSAGLLPASDIVVLAATWVDHNYVEAAALAEALVRRGKRVVIVGTGNFNDVTSLSMRLARRRIDPVKAERFFWDNKRTDAAKTAERLHARVAASPGIEFRSAYDLYCEGRRRHCRLYDPAGRPLMFDSGHVTVEGGRFMAQRLAKLGWLNTRSSTSSAPATGSAGEPRWIRSSDLLIKSLIVRPVCPASRPRACPMRSGT